MDQKKLVQFLSFWAVNSIVLIIATLLFGGNVVLGNASVPTSLAALVSGLLITLVNYLVPPALKKADIKIKNDNAMAGVYGAVNIVAVWVIKRFALVIGLGVSSIMYVVILGIILTVAQWGVAVATGAMKKPSK